MISWYSTIVRGVCSLSGAFQLDLIPVSQQSQRPVDRAAHFIMFRPIGILYMGTDSTGLLGSFVAGRAVRVPMTACPRVRVITKCPGTQASQGRLCQAYPTLGCRDSRAVVKHVSPSHQSKTVTHPSFESTNPIRAPKHHAGADLAAITTEPKLRSRGQWPVVNSPVGAFASLTVDPGFVCK